MNKELERFLQEEFGVTADELRNMSDEELNDIVDEAFEIEADEVMKTDPNPISKRGRLACDLEDYIIDNLLN